jgi:hypothetical protein
MMICGHLQAEILCTGHSSGLSNARLFATPCYSGTYYTSVTTAKKTHVFIRRPLVCTCAKKQNYLTAHLLVVWLHICLHTCCKLLSLVTRATLLLHENMVYSATGSLYTTYIHIFTRHLHLLFTHAIYTVHIYSQAIDIAAPIRTLRSDRSDPIAHDIYVHIH